MNGLVLVAFVAGLLLLVLASRLFLFSARLLLRLVVNGVIGGIFLWLVNLVGAGLGISVAINPLTALIAGFFGVPGVIGLIVLYNWPF